MIFNSKLIPSAAVFYRPENGVAMYFKERMPLVVS